MKLKKKMLLKNSTKINLTWINQSKNKVMFFEIKWFKLFTSYLIHLVLIKSLNHYLPKKNLLWLKINKPEFEELTREIYNNQDNKDFRITITKKTYDLKNAKNLWTKVTTIKISRNEAKKLYKELIQKNIDEIERERSHSIKKLNILKILKNIEAIFTGTYLHYGEVPKKQWLKKILQIV